MDILILGASGWIGGEIVKVLQTHPSHPCLTCTYHHHPPNHSTLNWVHLDTCDPDSFKHMEALQPDIVINALGWKLSDGFLDTLLSWTRKRASHLVQISTACVFDGEGRRPHEEHEPTCPHSDYGIAKARHERFIAEGGIQHTIVRFSAIHGFAPYRKTRTEIFLDRLQSQQTISVDQGVIQNRLSSATLGMLIAELALRHAEGIFHLGTSDMSEEFDFLYRLAIAFGYASNQVVKSDRVNSRNAVMIVDRILSLLGSDVARQTEERTIESLLRLPQSASYRAHA